MAETPSKSVSGGLQKPFVKMLLNLAQSPRERECLRVAIFQASDISATEARTRYGFEMMGERSSAVENCTLEAQEIRAAVEDLASTQDKALLKSYKIIDLTDSSDSGSDNDDTVYQKKPEYFTTELSADTTSFLVSLFRHSQFNFLSCQEIQRCAQGRKHGESLSFITNISEYSFNEHEVKLIQQSHGAYLSSLTEESTQQNIADHMNGDVVTDLESDSPEKYIDLSLQSEEARRIIMKKRAAIQRKARRLRAKMIAEKHFLSNKNSKRVSRILQECPDIGKRIKSFVQD